MHPKKYQIYLCYRPLLCGTEIVAKEGDRLACSSDGFLTTVSGDWICVYGWGDKYFKLVK